MHFFTEPSKLDTQSSGQEFGAIDENQYRLGNMFSSGATEDPKAFAVTDGLILVQKINGTDKYNIVLKPTQQPDLNFPKIDYIIYKGIKKESIIDGVKVADQNNNDLTNSIHKSAELWYENEGISMPSTEPAADTSLGLIYDAGASDQDYQLQDTDSLNEAFYSNNPVTLPFVFSGNHIGDFDITDDFGIIIIFEKIGFQPTFQLARELESILEFDPLDPSATNADIFRRKHEKEDVLCFIDAAAFFGSFFNLGINVHEGNDFELKEGDDLYSEVISKFLNKNKFYLDIRNECNSSFNYFENYGEDIFLNTVGTEMLEIINYYEDTWPILVLDNSDFSNSPNKTLKINFPMGDNDNPIIFLKRALLENIDLSDNSNRFIEPIKNDEDQQLDIEHRLQLLSCNNQICSNYYLIKLIKKYSTPYSNFKGLSLTNFSFLDNLYPLFDMNIPFKFGEVISKFYDEYAYIDKTNINTSDFIANIGIISDNETVNFLAFPKIYNRNEDGKKGIFSFSGQEYFEENKFLDILNKQVNFGINKNQFNTDQNSLNYLNFEEKTTPDTQDLLYSESNNLEHFQVENIELFSFTKNEYNTIVNIKETEFENSPYPIFLGIGSEEDLSLDLSKTKFVLRGLKEEDGEIILHEYSSSIEVIANESLYSWLGAKVRRYLTEFSVKTNSDFNNGIFGFDFMRDNYDKICISDFKSLEEEYTPYYINKIDGALIPVEDIDNYAKDQYYTYYTPWVSMKAGQSITLKMEQPRSLRGLQKEISSLQFTPNNNFTISPLELKDQNEVTITCNSNSNTDTRLELYADTDFAGAINIWHPQSKNIDLDWVFIEFSSSNIDQNKLNTLINKTKLDNAFLKGMNPALIDINVNNNVRVINMSTQYSVYQSHGYIPSTPFDFGDGSETYFDATHQNPLLGNKRIIELLNDDVTIVDTSRDNTKLTLYCVNRRFATSINPSTGQYSLVGGFSPIGTGVAFISKGESGSDVMAAENIIHEVLHSFGLRHSFENGLHRFQISKTDNYMDYKNNKRHTWKWQWKQVYNYPHLNL